MAKEKDVDPKVAEDKAEADNENLLAEAKELGITKSRFSTAGFKHKKPEELVREKERQEKLVVDRLKVRVAAKKAEAKMKPIDKRKALLVGRFKAIKSRTRPNSYTDANIKAWTEEYDMITNSPKSWNKITNNGTVPFVPGNKKKKTAREILDGMDLND